MRVLRITLRILLILFLLGNAVVAMHAYKFTRFQDAGSAVNKPEHMTTWEKIKVMTTGVNYPKSLNNGQPSLPYDIVSIVTEDSMHLSGWYIPADSARGTILLFHGHGSSKSALLPEADYLHVLGYNIFLVDFRAHGDSEGNTCTLGYRESKDVKAAYNYIQAKGETHIILWGMSLGAATITHAIAEENIQPEKVILELSFGNAYQAVKGRVRIMGLPEQPLSFMLTCWGSVIRNCSFFSLSPEDYARKINCPVLVQQAALDARVTKEEAETIYNNIPHSHKKLVIYQTAAHQSLYAKEPEKWTAEVKAFLAGQ